MRLRWTAVPLVLAATGCMRTLPPMPGVAVVSNAKAGVLMEEGTTPASEAGEQEDGDDERAEYVTPCKAGSVAQLAAEAAKDAFGKKVDALPVTADPKPLEEELERLLDEPCFELAKADPKALLTFPNALSLKDWWRSGGSDWLWSYLHLAERRMVHTAPTPRVALTLETAPVDHPLRPLLCPVDESKPCALDSSGWTRRAREKMTLLATGRPRRDEIDCREDAEKAPKADRYAAFRDCLEGTVQHERALPLGRFKAPTDGWFVIVDDHGTCRQVRAHDLATGATFHADDCAGGLRTRVGRTPVGALREAAWMMMLARETQGDVRFSRNFSIPDGFAIKRPRGETIGLGLIGCGCSPSDRHSWTWMREKNGVLRGQISGTIVGRARQDDAMRHAFDLRDVADDAFEAGCAPVAAAPRIAWSAAGPSSHEGEAAVLDDAASEPARLALAKARAPRTCTAKP